MFDLEYLFLKIRSKSVGEELNLTVTCQDDGETKVETTIDLEEVEVKIPDGHSKQIYVSDNISIKMKYPSMEQFIKNNFGGEQTSEEVFDIIADCIDQVIDGDEVHESANCSKERTHHFP